MNTGCIYLYSHISTFKLNDIHKYEGITDRYIQLYL